jgi:hypothetical protein
MEKKIFLVKKKTSDYPLSSAYTVDIKRPKKEAIVMQQKTMCFLVLKRERDTP